MQRVREILRLRAHGHELRPIGLSVGASPSTVHGYLQRAERAGISWSIAQTMSDSELRGALFPSGRGGTSAVLERAPFDCGVVHVELRRSGVTLLLLWQEYIADCERAGVKPYSYSQFCDRYSLYKKRLARSVRLTHQAGEKAFVDYSGKKTRILDRSTGELREVEVFVMTLAASGYSYAEASWSQTVPDFCSSLMRGLDFMGGVPEVLVPDQLRSAVSKPCRYDPEIHRTLADLAAHYGMTVLPARPRKPKDKAKVEGAVLLVQRWILAKIRNERFESLEELNERIRELVRELNDRPFQKLSGSRRTLFETLDKPALRALPQARFELGEWRKARVHPDGHVSYKERYYSVPSRCVGDVVELWVTPSVVEVYADGERVASHRRSYAPKGTAVTDESHLSEAASEAKKWPKERMLSWARSHGSHVERAATRILSSYPRPEFGYRAVLGILRLADQYGSNALDEACERALGHEQVAPRRRFLQALLQKRKSTQENRRSLGRHEHLREAQEFDFGGKNMTNETSEEIH
jgi:transposase